MPIKITRDAFDFIAHASRNTYPEEFVGLLRKNKKGVINTILIIPLSEFGDGFSSINFNMVPMQSDSCGSVHSHPNGVPLPSHQDKLFFSKLGGVHLIIASPYDERSVRGFDEKGKPMAVQII
ncbi:MAG: Mov34/MPN/PAD-1 family protein [Candidatus Burarchaeum sp.]|nr:Mov34/MPN/PAD-1 family protein [Candidatus Burarchaeum sp.]MDO8339880.1 Mov34/MPN/PAD-1 family protein [Candidatus Burarchaeum sp.]